ncbi:unnamed protein product [Lactuca virosa]|uniref:WAT1-related protein n=1 Tax=Lactuca virosa TaxID=75947 RepID=A0AAU9PBV8_9ASTR|nr:unnamed protein product [Lactuca virosa]
MAAVLIPVVLFAGSPITSAYVALQFFKLDAIGYKRGHSVLIAKIIISALGCLMLGTFIYVLIVDGSPFNATVLSRCMIATTTNVYFCIVTVVVWIAYKESRWISAFFWILSLLCFGGSCFTFHLSNHFPPYFSTVVTKTCCQVIHC